MQIALDGWTFTFIISIVFILLIVEWMEWGFSSPLCFTQMWVGEWEGSSKYICRRIVFYW